MSSIIERLIRKQKSKRESKLSDFYNQIGNKYASVGNVSADATDGASGSNSMLDSSSSSNSIVIQLDSVRETKAAVYQTVKVQKDDNIKTEVKEVHEMLQNSNVFLGPDGKIVTTFPAEKKQIENLYDTEVTCEICKFYYLFILSSLKITF